jgi:hypothetical protein
MSTREIEQPRPAADLGPHTETAVCDLADLHDRFDLDPDQPPLQLAVLTVAAALSRIDEHLEDLLCLVRDGLA